MTGLHSGDGVSVDLLVGSDGSSLGSVHGSSGSVVSSDTGGVSGLGNLSGVSSFTHGSNGSVVSVNRSNVVVYGFLVYSLGEVKTHLGSVHVLSGLSVHSSGVSGALLGVGEVLLESLDSSVVFLGSGVPHVHDSVPFVELTDGMVNRSASSSAGSTSHGVVSLGLSGGLHGADMGPDRGVEGFGPGDDSSVLAGSPRLALEVNHGMVSSSSHELSVLAHVSGSGLLSGGEVLGGVQPVETVIGLGHGGDSGEEGNFSEHW